eukprot:2920433-Pyramimonas_sp.AAC.1
MALAGAVYRESHSIQHSLVRQVVEDLVRLRRCTKTVQDLPDPRDNHVAWGVVVHRPLAKWKRVIRAALASAIACRRRNINGGERQGRDLKDIT